MGYEGKPRSAREDSRALRLVHGCGHFSCRMALELLRRGLTVRERWGHYFHRCLTRAAEDALLGVVAGT